MPREQNGYKEENDEEFLSEALTLSGKITDEAAKKIILAQIKAISSLPSCNNPISWGFI